MAIELTENQKEALSILFPEPKNEEDEKFYLWAHHYGECAQEVDPDDPIPLARAYSDVPGRWWNPGICEDDDEDAETKGDLAGTWTKEEVMSQCRDMDASFLSKLHIRPVFASILLDWATSYQYRLKYRLYEFRCDDAEAWAKDNMPNPIPALLGGTDA